MKKERLIWIFSIIVIISLFLLTNSCNKDDDIDLTESEIGTLSDIDGNIYKTVKIGNQWWMAENLKTTKFRDNTAIPLVSNDNLWNNLLSPGYCWYDNDASTYKADYGALYNAYAVETEELCPAGWHIPTYSEWEELFTFLGGNNVAGVKLMEEGTTHWIAPNSEATNESGFTALPGGYRMMSYFHIGDRGYWWIKSENYNSYRVLLLPGGFIDIVLGAKDLGYSVRCIKD